MQRNLNERCILIFPVFISCLTIFGCLTIATFEPTRTTTIFDTKQPSLTEKSTENEGLSPATTRWQQRLTLIQCNDIQMSVAI